MNITGTEFREAVKRLPNPNTYPYHTVKTVVRRRMPEHIFPKEVSLESLYGDVITFEKQYGGKVIVAGEVRDRFFWSYNGLRLTVNTI